MLSCYGDLSHTERQGPARFSLLGLPPQGPPSGIRSAGLKMGPVPGRRRRLLRDDPARALGEGGREGLGTTESFVPFSKKPPYPAIPTPILHSFARTQATLGTYAPILHMWGVLVST